jgi:hypothetical protein
MKPAWDKLMDEFKDSKTALVGDVDCTAAGKPLCDSNGVQGFPTIKYGDPSNLEKYEGGRDLPALQKFASENLGPTCGPSNLELCNDEQKAMIEKFNALSDADRAAQIAEGDKKLADAEATFKSEVEKLSATHKKLTKEKEDTIAAVKKSGLQSLKQVKAFTAGNKCRVADPKDCDEKETTFIGKFKDKSKEDIDKQVARLKKMMGSPMKEELKQWLIKRLLILLQLQK